MTKDEIEEYAGNDVRITLVDGAIFSGVLWFVKYVDQTEEEVYSISLSTSKYEFPVEFIRKIEQLNNQ